LRTRLQLQRGRQGDHGRGDAERQAALVALAAHHLHVAPRLRRHEHGRRVRGLRAAAPPARACQAWGHAEVCEREARVCCMRRVPSLQGGSDAQAQQELRSAVQAWTLVLADSMGRIVASHTRRAAGQIRAPDRGGVGAARVAAVAHHQGRAAAQIEGNGVGAPAPRVRHRGARVGCTPSRAVLTYTHMPAAAGGGCGGSGGPTHCCLACSTCARVTTAAVPYAGQRAQSSWRHGSRRTRHGARAGAAPVSHEHERQRAGRRRGQPARRSIRALARQQLRLPCACAPSSNNVIEFRIGCTDAHAC